MAPPKRPWFRFYTEALTDPKLRRLTPEERWLYVAVLGAARQSSRPGWLMLTDSLPFEHEDLAELAGMTVAKVVKGTDKMQDLGLIGYEGETWFVPSWDARQFESDKVTERVAKHRRSNDDVTAYRPGSNGDDPSDVTPPETETDTEAENTSSAIAADADPTISDLCSHLADWVESNGSKRPTITDRWHTACRLMIERDGRTPDQIRNAIDWCQGDEFWRSNVMSMPKLREKFDQLRLAAKRPNRESAQMSKARRALEAVARTDIERDAIALMVGEAS